MQKTLRVAYTELTPEQYAALIKWLGDRPFTWEHDDSDGAPWVTVLDVTEADMENMESVIRG